MIEDDNELRDAEQSIIAYYRKRSRDAPWIGLAFSGGGIRSATFCIGAMQALSHAHLIKRFDYISSVSGGGYAASALQWWRHKGGTTGSDFSSIPYGTELHAPDGDNNKALAFLRWHSKYLTPGTGITIWSGLAAIIRTVFINLLIWIPVLSFLLFFIIHIGATVDIQHMINHVCMADSMCLGDYIPALFYDYPIFLLMVIIVMAIVLIITAPAR